MSRDKPSSGRMRIAPQRSPGVGRGAVAIHPRSPEPAPATLSEALQDAVESAVVGELLRPALEGTAKTAALQVLYRHGIRDARVQARLSGTGIAVTVVLPAGPKRVSEVVLRVGTMG
jgi:hypothetical protein